MPTPKGDVLMTCTELNKKSMNIKVKWCVFDWPLMGPRISRAFVISGVALFPKLV